MSYESLIISWQTQQYEDSAWCEEKDKPEIAHQTAPVFPDYRARIEKYWGKEGPVKSLWIADCSLRTLEERLEVDVDSPPSWFHRITVDMLQEWFDRKVGWVWIDRFIDGKANFARQPHESVVSFRFVEKRVFGWDCVIVVLLASGESAMMHVMHDNVSDTFRFSRVPKQVKSNP